MQKCDAHKALICAIGADDRPLASRRAARLIAAGQSEAAILEDLLKAIQIRSYNETDRDLACLVAIGIGGSRALCALNRARRLPSEDILRERLRLDPPLLPNQPPIVEGAPQAQCARSATIWASGRTRDPYFEILGAPRGIMVTPSGAFDF